MSKWHPRPAAASDYDAFVAFFAELGVDDPIPTALQWETELSPRAIFVESADGQAAGYGRAVPLDGVGHIQHVVVAPAFRGRGVGRVVMDVLFDRLRTDGCAEACLNVKMGNVPAIRLYEGYGLTKAYRSAVLWLAWGDVAKLPEDAAPPRVVPLTAREDGAAERAFNIPRGRLASLRATRRCALRCLADPLDPSAPPLGVASFNPHYPGVFPFRVARPTYAKTLLRALAPLAREGDASLQLVIEDDDETVSALREAGASTRFELHHMSGPVPPAG